MAAGTSKLISLLLAIFCSLPLPAFPSEMSPECRRDIERLNTKSDTAAIATALDAILGLPEGQTSHADQVKLVIDRLTTRRVPEAEITRLLGAVTAKLLAAHENPQSRTQSAQRTRALLDGVEQAQELVSLLAALRNEGPAAEKLFKQLAKQAKVRARPPSVEAEKNEEPKPELRAPSPPSESVSLSPPAIFIPLRSPPVPLQAGWIDGLRLGLPTLTTPYKEKLRSKGQSPMSWAFEAEALKWIREQGELLYAVGSEQLTEVFGGVIKKNVDALSVTEDPAGLSLNIREFKLGLNPYSLQHSQEQMRSTLKMLLAINPHLRIGKLGLLYNKGRGFGSGLPLRVRGQDFTIHFRQIEIPEGPIK